MLTLRRFRELADSYGGDLQRWPRETRDQARALLNVSSQARALLDRERALDDAIAAACAPSDATARRISESDAVLTRLRSVVTARTAGPIPNHHPARWHHVRASFGRVNGVISEHLVWVGMATSSSLAIIVGFLVGTLYGTAPASDAVLSMLQPIHILY
jgi:hypothetical protein